MTRILVLGLALSLSPISRADADQANDSSGPATNAVPVPEGWLRVPSQELVDHQRRVQSGEAGDKLFATNLRRRGILHELA